MARYATHSSKALGSSCQTLGSFVPWGLFPLYLVLLDQVAASEVLAHRILWSTLLLGPLLALRGRWRGAVGVRREPRRLGFLRPAAPTPTPRPRAMPRRCAGSRASTP